MLHKTILASWLSSLSLVCGTAVATTLVVSNPNDSGPGSLRAQIAAASAGDTIEFAVTGTIVLTSGQILITKPLTITGPGPDVLTISGNNVSRIFRADDNNAATDSLVSISGLRLTNGRPTFDITPPCPAPNGSGGAILSAESLQLSNLLIENNTSPRQGGGIGFFPTLSGQSFTMSDSTLRNNETLCTGSTTLNSGGALVMGPESAVFPVAGTVQATLTRVKILNNTAERHGGGISTSLPGVMTVRDSVISGNTSLTRNGGGIMASWNTGLSHGASMLIERTELSGNTANNGGAILATNESPSLQTLNGTTATVLLNSTVSGNVAHVSGGGVYLYGNVNLTVANSTVANNSAEAGASGGIHLEVGDVSGSNGATPNLRNSLLVESAIIAGNSGTIGTKHDLNYGSGAPDSIGVGNSLIQAYNPVLNLVGSGNLFGVDPKLGPLANNGGTSRTHALLAASPAIDKGINPVSLTNDQRGIYSRVAGAAIDMGAFEYDAKAGTSAAGTVVEFYNTVLDNYFITADAGEANAIDAGSAGAGWIRTGKNFKSGGDAAVCRFYGSQSPGPNSHFYTVSGDECASLKQLQASTPVTQRRWNFESLDFVSVMPVTQTCRIGTIPVYRAYNNGFARGVDSNHRISSDITAIQEVVNRGWANEGIVMCAPQ